MYGFKEYMLLLENFEARLKSKGVTDDVIAYIGSLADNRIKGKAISMAMSNPRLTIADLQDEAPFRSANRREDQMIKTADPTTDHSYYLAIYRWLNGNKDPKVDRSAIFPEDINKVKEVLEHYNKNKARYKTKFVTRYRSFHELQSEYLKLVPQKSERQRMAEIKARGAEKLLDSPQWLVIKITEPDAACLYAKGTRWCTSDEEYASHYIRKTGALYVFFEKRLGHKYQADGEFDQIMDAEDRPVRSPVLEEIFGIGMDLGILEAFDQAIKRAYPIGKEREKALLSILGKMSKQKAGSWVRYNIMDINADQEFELFDEFLKIWIADTPITSGVWMSPIINRVITKPNKTFENAVWQNVEGAIQYATEITKERLPRAEEGILAKASQQSLNLYIQRAYKDRWPEAEKRLKTNPAVWAEYTSFVRKTTGQKVDDLTEEELFNAHPADTFAYIENYYATELPIWTKMIQTNEEYWKKIVNKTLPVFTYLRKFKLEAPKLMEFFVKGPNSTYASAALGYFTEVLGRDFDRLTASQADFLLTTPQIPDWNKMIVFASIKKPFTERQEIKYFLPLGPISSSRYFENSIERVVNYAVKFNKRVAKKVEDELGMRSEYHAADYANKILKTRWADEKVHQRILNAAENTRYLGTAVGQYAEDFGDL